MTTAPDQLAIGLTDGTFYGGDPFPAFAWIAITLLRTTTSRPASGGSPAMPTSRRSPRIPIPSPMPVAFAPTAMRSR